MTQLSVQDMVHTPEAQNLGEALNNLNDEAKRKIFASLQDTQHSIAVGTWVLQDDTTDKACGCLMMDGVLEDPSGIIEEHIGDVGDVNDSDESTVLKMLYSFYGYDNSNDAVWEWDDNGYVLFHDTTLATVAGRFDTFARAYELVDVHFYCDKVNNTTPVGVLSDKGRAAVLAVFHKYVAVSFPEPSNDSPQ